MCCKHLLADLELVWCEFECGWEGQIPSEKVEPSEEVEPTLPSVLIADPSAWLATYNDLYTRALMRSGQLIDHALFMGLPQEVRDLIYSYVLASSHPIKPHLCNPVDSKLEPSFHDANDTDHASVFQLTALTRVDKRFREEALPVFYAANVFATGDDTVTYLQYLKRMGRLEWVQNVELVIEAGGLERAAWLLRCVEQVDVEGAKHEREGRMAVLRGEGQGPGETRVWKGGAGSTGTAAATGHMSTLSYAAGPAPYPASTALSTPLTAQDLTLSRHYHVSGFRSLSLALLLRLLSTPSATSPQTRQIVLPLARPQIFAQNAKLRWFPTLAHGLGLSLRFVERAGSVQMDGQERCVVVRWERRFQGLHEVETVVAKGGEKEEEEEEKKKKGESGQGVLERARQMIPQMESLRRSKKTCFSRKGCREGRMVWFDLETFGGANA
ncbi:hypothetical protein SVAN01_04475 [Stagonosporopsis vannaccii]|nr:hypothetical protein SVAN01_04475 [Stagonosporopsis vannaccii]